MGGPASPTPGSAGAIVGVAVVLNRALRVLGIPQPSSPLALSRSTAFASRFGCQIAVGRKAAGLRRDGATTFAPCVRSESPILREASLFVRDVGTALSGNLALFAGIHAGEATQCDT